MRRLLLGKTGQAWPTPFFLAMGLRHFSGPGMMLEGATVMKIFPLGLGKWLQRLDWVSKGTEQWLPALVGALCLDFVKFRGGVKAWSKRFHLGQAEQSLETG